MLIEFLEYFVEQPPYYRRIKSTKIECFLHHMQIHIYIHALQAVFLYVSMTMENTRMSHLEKALYFMFVFLGRKKVDRKFVSVFDLIVRVPVRSYNSSSGSSPMSLSRVRFRIQVQTIHYQNDKKIKNNLL